MTSRTTQSTPEPGAVEVLVRIRSTAPSLAPAEARVAAIVLADPGGASARSIGALAEQAQTSVTTVMRFCRSIGLDNYPQLRLALAAAAARESALTEGLPLGGDIDANDSLRQVVDKLVYNEARALEDTATHLDLDALAAAVDALVSARRIDIFGVGASGFVGQDLHQKLHRIGLIAFVWTDPHAALTATALLGPGDVAIGISHSGATLDTLQPLAEARRRGAATLAVTNFPRSPIAEQADLLLATAARETALRSGATASRIAQLAVIDCLFVGVAQRSYDQSMQYLASTYDAIALRAAPSGAAQTRTQGEDTPR